MNYHLPLINLGIGVTAALVVASPVRSAQFTDVAPNYWAYDYIEALAARQIINGYEDGRFRPMETVTRSQFAAIVRQAFLASEPIPELSLAGVPLNYWAYDALAIARVRGFLPGELDAPVQPGQVMTRGDALAALVNGLGYESDGVDLAYYVDAEQIPEPLHPAIAAATQAQLVVGYPEVNWLYAERPVTRAEVAAFIYQALVKEGRTEPLTATPYVANSPDAAWLTTPIATIPVTVQQMSWSRGGTRLATLSPDSDLIKVWNGQTGAAVTAIVTDGATRFHGIALNQAGTQIAAIAQTVPENAFALQLWDLETGQRLWQQFLGRAQGQFRDEAGFVSIAPPKVAFQSEDKGIFSQIYLGVDAADRPDDLQLRLHDTVTGTTVRFLEPTPAVKYRQFVLSPDGVWLAGFGVEQPGGMLDPAQATDPIIDIWQVDTGSRNRTLRPVTNDLGFVNMVFTANDSLRVLSQHLYDIHLATWNVRTGEPLEQRTDLPLIDRQDRLGRLSPDGEHYFVRSDVAGTRLINIPQGTVTYLPGHAHRATFDPTGDYLAIAAQETVQIFTRSARAMP